jgi:hypothetical protein
MEKIVESLPVPKKKWIAPKLKKADVETLTASGFSTPSGDATGFS